MRDVVSSRFSASMVGDNSADRWNSNRKEVKLFSSFLCCWSAVRILEWVSVQGHQFFREFKLLLL